MYDWPSVAMTGFSDVASPLSPMTKSLPAAGLAVGVKPMSATSSTSSMAWITSVLRSWASRRVASQRRIRRVAQPVAEQVESQHCDEDGQPGEGRDPPGRGQELPSLDDHVAPARQRRLGAEPKITQAGLDQDRLAQEQAGLDDHDRQRVHEHVAPEDPNVTGTQRRRGVDEIAVAEAQALAAHDPRDRRPGDERDNQRGVGEAGAEEGDHDQDQ